MWIPCRRGRPAQLRARSIRPSGGENDVYLFLFLFWLGAGPGARWAFNLGYLFLKPSENFVTPY